MLKNFMDPWHATATFLRATLNISYSINPEKGLMETNSYPTVSGAIEITPHFPESKAINILSPAIHSCNNGLPFALLSNAIY